MTTAVSALRWSAAADAYDAWFDRPWGRHATAVEHRLLIDAAGPITRRVVLDAGCGTGRFMHRLEAEGATVTGTDRDPDALTIADTGTTGCAPPQRHPPPPDPGPIVRHRVRCHRLRVHRRPCSCVRRTGPRDETGRTSRGRVAQPDQPVGQLEPTQVHRTRRIRRASPTGEPSRASAPATVAATFAPVSTHRRLFQGSSCGRQHSSTSADG